MGQLTDAQKKQAAQNAAVRRSQPAPAPKPVIAAPPAKKSILDVFRPAKTMGEVNTTVKKAAKK